MQKGFAHIIVFLLLSLVGIGFFVTTQKRILLSLASDETKTVKMWMVEYIPPGGVRSVYPSAQVNDPTSFTQNTLLPAMNEASKYHGYNNPSAQPSLNYVLDPANIVVENNIPPLIGPNQYDYNALFTKYDLCNFAKANDIKAVIIWGAGSGTYQGGFAESAVTGNKGIRTNGPSLPNCPDKTIVLYGLNYERGLAEAMESYGHHLETVLRDFRPEYWDWADEDKPANNLLVGRGDSCGTVHNPPNARCEYDRSNPSGWLSCGATNAPGSVPSDCRNWKPDGTGTKETLDCTLWNCDRVNDDKNFIIWWMQNMPGMSNGLIGKDGNPIPNWWVYIGDPDNCYGDPFTCSGATPSPTPIATFSNLSANLVPSRAEFNFAFSGVSPSYSVDLAVADGFTTGNGIYWNFANGSGSPIIETNTSKMTQYQCGAVMDWQVKNYNGSVVSPVQRSVVVCPTATPTPTNSPSPTPIVDIISPYVAITNPLNGGKVSRNKTITIRANATDNIGVKNVEFYVNGVLKCRDTLSPYTCNWKVPNQRNVVYTINAKALDNSGNSSSHTISVTSQ